MEKGEKPKLARECIESWKRILPEYEIIEWNEDNFDINSNLYMKQAYDVKKYAFVTDYVRLYVLYKYWGIYMDTDVEALQPIDKFLKSDEFTRFESEKFCVTGIIGSKKGNKMIKELLEIYDNINFINEDGSLNEVTNTTMITKKFKEFGVVLNNTHQIVYDMEIFPKTYFCPLGYGYERTDFSKDTYAIHHFAGSWLPKKVQKRRKRKKV